MDLGDDHHKRLSHVTVGVHLGTGSVLIVMPSKELYPRHGTSVFAISVKAQCTFVLMIDCCFTSFSRLFHLHGEFSWEDRNTI